jgi:CRISPR-associated exonuclease Cas4
MAVQGKRSFDWSHVHGQATAQRRPLSAAPPADSAHVDGEAESPTLADLEADAALALRVNDLKQYAYCPRIVFYQYAMPVERKATFKMEHGKAVEPRLQQLEERRKLREYGLADGRRDFQVSLMSRRLGLSGRLDLMITTPHGVFPVDFKDTLGPVQHNHHVQLCTYALLIEESTAHPVSTGFVYRVPRDDVVVVEITLALRAETIRMIKSIREMIRMERMPPPTSKQARCVDCEYRNYCGDVF